MHDGGEQIVNIFVLFQASKRKLEKDTLNQMSLEIIKNISTNLLQNGNVFSSKVYLLSI